MKIGLWFWGFSCVVMGGFFAVSFAMQVKDFVDTQRLISLIGSMFAFGAMVSLTILGVDVMMESRK